jgi:hypothetical protein
MFLTRNLERNLALSAHDQLHARRPGFGAFMRRLTAALTAPPACAVCGRGPASTGWMVDAAGRVSGRCSLCVGKS